MKALVTAVAGLIYFHSADEHLQSDYEISLIGNKSTGSLKFIALRANKRANQK